MTFNVMLAKSYDPKHVKNWRQMSIEKKLDGVRVIVTIEGGNVMYRSRSGRVLNMFDHMDQSFLGHLRALRRVCAEYDDGVMFDGEMVADSFDDIAGAIHRKDHTADYATFFCFHVMPIRAFEAGEDTEPQSLRQHEMISAAKLTKVPHIEFSKGVKVRDDGEVRRRYKAFRRADHEGAIVKDLSQPWVGKRSSAWLKVKPEESDDLKVVGYTGGKGKYAGQIGALVCARKIGVGRTGRTVHIQVGGFTDALRKAWTVAPQTIMHKIVEVAYHEVTKDGSLRHPRFVRVRTDRD